MRWCVSLYVHKNLRMFTYTVIAVKEKPQAHMSYICAHKRGMHVTKEHACGHVFPALQGLNLTYSSFCRI